MATTLWKIFERSIISGWWGYPLSSFFFLNFFLTYCAFFGLNVIIFLEFVLNQVIDKIKKKKLLGEESFVA